MINQITDTVSMVSVFCIAASSLNTAWVFKGNDLYLGNIWIHSFFSTQGWLWNQQHAHQEGEELNKRECPTSRS